MLVFLRVYACVYVPYMAMHALRVAVGIGGLRLESIFERVAHQPALAGGMCALHTKFVRFLIKTSNTLLYECCGQRPIQRARRALTQVVTAVLTESFGQSEIYSARPVTDSFEQARMHTVPTT